MLKGPDAPTRTSHEHSLKCWHGWLLSGLHTFYLPTLSKSDVSPTVQEAGAFTEEQKEKIWGCWYETVAVMVRLKPMEVQLQAQVHPHPFPLPDILPPRQAAAIQNSTVSRVHISKRMVLASKCWAKWQGNLLCDPCLTHFPHHSSACLSLQRLHDPVQEPLARLPWHVHWSI